MIEEVVARFSIFLEAVVDRFDGSLASRVFLLLVGIILVSLFIYFFYRSTAKRDILDLDLRKYNSSQHPISRKIFAIALYLIEYIIIIPLILLLWYGALSLFLLFLAAPGQQVSEILFASAATIGAIRALAYFKSQVSQELASLFPYIALSVFLLSPSAFNLDSLFAQVSEIPLLFSEIFSYMVVVFGIEIFLRAIYALYDFWVSEEEALNGALKHEKI